MKAPRLLLALVLSFAAALTVFAADASEKVYELRTYTAPPGKLNELLARFRQHTLKIFERHGMVNHVVPRSELTSRTLELAGRIAANDPFTMKLVKESMNFAQDEMGRKAAMDHAFQVHQIGHVPQLRRDANGHRWGHAASCGS